MYKIIAADDEPYVLEGLRIMVDWDKYGFELSDTAADGETAYRKIMSQRPELVIADIKMPGIDGLELARRLCENGYDGEIIILTAYAEIDYARTAIKYGVKDFVSKPLDSEELHGVLADFKRELDRKSEMNMLGSRVKSNHSKNKNSSIIAVRSKVNAVDFEFFADVRMYEHRDGIRSYIISTDGDIEAVSNEFFAKITEADGNAFGCVAYFVGNESANTAYIRATDSLIRIVKPEKGNLYGVCEHNLKDIKASVFGKYADKLTECIEFGDNEEMQSVIDKFFVLLCDARQTMQYAKLVYSYIIIHLRRITVKYGDMPQNVHSAFSTENNMFTGLYDYYEVISKMCNEVIEYIARIKNEPNERISETVEKYLIEHYKEKVVIKDIAMELYASPGYLGTVFTKEMGVSIKDYMHGLRMEEAARLINETDKHLNEIAYEVGYSNYNHFFKKFEEFFGMTPIDYKKTYSKR